MKVTLLLAPCSFELLKRSVQVVTNVLRELEVEIHQVELHKLPYYNGQRTRQMDHVMQSVRESEGVIAMTAVPMLGMQGAMQTFFDQCTLYEMSDFNKPMLAITSSKWLGEQEAAQLIQKCWSVVGGVEGSSVAMNENLPHQPYYERLEKEVENFYRLMKQKRTNIGCGERTFYYRNIKERGHDFQISENVRQTAPSEMHQKPEIKDFAQMIRNDGFAEHLNKTKEPEMPQDPAAVHINLSTKEQTIKELASLMEQEAKGSGFNSIQSGVYTRPPKINTGITGSKKLQQIPHYFAAQYDKELAMTLKYRLTDLEEEGYIIIQGGDCVFKEKAEGTPTVEMILTEEVLQEILIKKITYQKAFMLGKLKVKGNFAVLPKLDQVFKEL